MATSLHGTKTTMNNDSSSVSIEQNDDDRVVNLNKAETSQDGIKLITTMETMDSNQEAISDAQLPDTEAAANISSKKQKTVKDGQDKDDDEPEATLRDLYKALADLGSHGSTCVGGVATNLPVQPGLVVEGVGLVPLPLTQETAEKLKSVARQAPHGRGTETVVDTSVRNTLEVDANKVALTNPHWPAALTKLVRDAATTLGVDENLVRPEFYKLLLYEKGGFFKKHRDTEKAEGMFATLVVQLPSYFTGGSFVVTHNGKSQNFRLDDPDTSPYQCHYLALYADCEHEILPVESGNRLALIYSLCYTGIDKTSPSPEDLSKNSLLSVMNRLNLSQTLFAIPLQHKYTSLSLAHLGVGALKGADRKLSKMVLQGSSDGWELLIIKADRTDYQYEDLSNCYDAFKTNKGESKIQELFHSDGSDASAQKAWLARELNFKSVVKKGMILASTDVCRVMWEQVMSRDLDYTGNECTEREVTYQTYLLVVFSKHGERKIGMERK